MYAQVFKYSHGSQAIASFGPLVIIPLEEYN